MSFFALLDAYKPALLRGLGVTAELSLIVWCVGLVCGTGLAVLASRSITLDRTLRTAGFVVGSIPAIVLLVWAFYPLQTVTHTQIAPFWTAAGALCVINILGVQGIVRPALASFPREFRQASRISGMSERQVLLHITLPLLVRQLTPALLFSQVAMLHATLFASLISVEEIFRVTQQINAQVYQPVELYTALALLFLIVCAPLNWLGGMLQRRYSRDLAGI